MPVALVTGGSRGIGSRMALSLAENGYDVVINYLVSQREAEDLIGGKIRCAIKADVRDAGQVEKMASRIDRVFGRIDVIINNAGITRDNLLLRQSESEWDEVIGTNLNGCFNVIKRLAPLMIRSGGGHIVNISSYSGVKGKAGQAAYSASKAAILGLSRTAAAELAEHNIRVNAVLPGYVMTDMGKKARQAMEKAKQNSIINRLSSPAEVAMFILYLLQTENITGQVFSIDSRII